MEGQHASNVLSGSSNLSRCTIFFLTGGVMIHWLKTLCCKHDIQIVEDYTWVIPKKDTWEYVYHPRKELRKYMVCVKCGYKKKISKK